MSRLERKRVFSNAAVSRGTRGCAGFGLVSEVRLAEAAQASVPHITAR